MQKAFILFYCSEPSFILLQPSVQLQHFHARLAGGRDLWPVGTPRQQTL